MNVKKVLLSVLSAAMLVSTFAGCGGKNENAGLTEDGKVLLQITTAQKEVNEESYNKSINRFREFEEFYKNEYPDSKGVAIEPHYYTYDPKDYAAVAAGGQLATSYSVHLTEAKSIMESGYAKDITKWMEEYGYLNGIDEKIKKNIEKDG